MVNQLHKSFRNQQVRSMLQSYINKEVELLYILDILKIGRYQMLFYELRDSENPSRRHQSSPLLKFN